MEPIDERTIEMQNNAYWENEQEIINTLSQYPNVEAVNLRLRRRKDEVENEICVSVEVSQKVSTKSLKSDQLLPQEIFGIPVDVCLKEVRHDVIQDDTATHRPLVGGIQIGASGRGGVGTLGCLATVSSGEHNGKLVMLGNFHVMCQVNDTEIKYNEIGQPTYSSCCSDKEVGKVIDGEYTDSKVDCAIAEVYTGRPNEPRSIKALEWYIQGFGQLSGEAPTIGATNYSCRVGDTVFIRGAGASSKVSQGIVDKVNDNFTIHDAFRRPIKAFTDTLYILNRNADRKPYSSYGDSGAVILNTRNQVVGLHFGGTPSGAYGLGCHIKYVTDRLKIDIPHVVIGGNGGVLVSSTTHQPIDLAELKNEPYWFYKLEDQLAKVPLGQSILKFLNTHREEVRKLVWTDRETKLAWHRNSGPAYVIHLKNSVQDDNYQFPSQVNGTSIQNLILKMASVLQRKGSQKLRNAIEAIYLPILEASSQGASVSDWLTHLQGETANRSTEKH